MLVLTAVDVDKVTDTFTPSFLLSLTAKALSSSPCSPPRTSLEVSNHTALVMPAHIPAIGTAVKVVCVPRAPDDSRGLPASTIVLDENTGAASALVNATSLTALRTAAASLLATHLIGPKHPTTLLAYGAGKQIAAHLALHLRFFPSLRTCTIVNRTLNPRLQALIASLRKSFPHVDFAALPSAAADLAPIEAALRAAHVVVAATPARTPLFPAAHVAPGTHVILVGSYTPAMQEVDGELIRRAGRVLVDSREACAREAGEIIGAGRGADEMVELGEVVSFVPDGGGRGPSGGAPLGAGAVVDWQRVSALRAGDVTVFKSVGVGAMDVAIACAVVRRAGEMGVGVRVEGF